MGGMKRKPENWRDHRPQMSVVEPGVDLDITGCRDCLWRSSDQSYGAAGFSAHLDDLGAPDYMLEYFRFWAGIVEVPFGHLNRDQVARELFDYGKLMENASQVYDDLAGLSKPNTDPAYIVQGAERKYREHHAYELAERAWYLVQDGRPDVAEELREIAEEWREGIVAEVEEDLQRRAKMLREVVVENAPPL
jgi:hypothetical protein